MLDTYLMSICGFPSYYVLRICFPIDANRGSKPVRVVQALPSQKLALGSCRNGRKLSKAFSRMEGSVSCNACRYP